MVCIVMYLTSTHIAPYEVKKGSLSGNYKYTALALKSETVVEAPESGAVTYYAREGTEIGKNGVICSINENGTTRTERTSASSQTTESASLTESTELSESTTESSAETETTAESTDEKDQVPTNLNGECIKLKNNPMYIIFLIFFSVCTLFILTSYFISYFYKYTIPYFYFQLNTFTG